MVCKGCAAKIPQIDYKNPNDPGDPTNVTPIGPYFDPGTETFLPDSGHAALTAEDFTSTPSFIDDGTGYTDQLDAPLEYRIEDSEGRTCGKMTLLSAEIGWIAGECNDDCTEAASCEFRLKMSFLVELDYTTQEADGSPVTPSILTTPPAISWLPEDNQLPPQITMAADGSPRPAEWSQDVEREDFSIYDTYIWTVTAPELTFRPGCAGDESQISLAWSDFEIEGGYTFEPWSIDDMKEHTQYGALTIGCEICEPESQPLGGAGTNPEGGTGEGGGNDTGGPPGEPPPSEPRTPGDARTLSSWGGI